MPISFEFDGTELEPSHLSRHEFFNVTEARAKLLDHFLNSQTMIHVSMYIFCVCTRHGDDFTGSSKSS